MKRPRQPSGCRTRRLTSFREKHQRRRALSGGLCRPDFLPWEAGGPDGGVVQVKYTNRFVVLHEPGGAASNAMTLGKARLPSLAFPGSDQARKGRLVDALAARGDEGRGTLRKVMGSREQALIHECPNGETHLIVCCCRFATHAPRPLNAGGGATHREGTSIGKDRYLSPEHIGV
jgi:hypothetical protein